MPIFTRRNLQRMLDDVGPFLSRSDAVELLNRLNHEIDPDKCVPAEYELALSWVIARSGKTELQPKFGKKTPDIVSYDLFPGTKAAIEIMAISDESLSGETAMRRTSNIINNFADSVRPKANKHLHYRFLDSSDYRPVKMRVPLGQFTHRSKYFRTRHTSVLFELTAEHEKQIRQWMENRPPTRPLRIVGKGTDVLVSWQERVHPMLRTFSSMPSEAHSLTDNILYKRLKQKEREQLSAVPSDYLKCIFLGDAGCTLLRNPNESDAQNRRVNGRQIIGHFLENSTIDIVCIFTPQDGGRGLLTGQPNKHWMLFIGDLVQRQEGFHDKLFAVQKLLPVPNLNGYQVRSWVQQGMCAPQGRGQYLPLSYSRSTARLSTRALLELLAGRMNADDFKNWITRDDNQFERYLSHGMAISDMKFEPRGPDEDDDYVVISLAPDPNASALRLPEKLKGDKPKSD